MKNLILIPILFVSYILNAQYIVVKPSQLPAASTINPTDLFIINQGTTTKKVTSSILNTALKDTFATKSALKDTAAAIRASSGSGSTIDTSLFVRKAGSQIITGSKTLSGGLLLTNDTTQTQPNSAMTEQQVKREVNAKDGGWIKRANATKYIGAEDSVVIKDFNGESGDDPGIYYYYNGNVVYTLTPNVFDITVGGRINKLSYGGMYSLPLLAYSFNNSACFSYAATTNHMGMFINNEDTIKFGRNYEGVHQGDYFYTTKSGFIGIVSNGVKTYEVDSAGKTRIGVINKVQLDSVKGITLTGSATVWKDLNFSPLSSSGNPALLPDYVTINNTTHREFTSLNNQVCGDNKEIPHEYKLNSNLYPHAHFFLKSGESAGTTGVTFTLYWELRQDSGVTSGLVTLSATSAELTANPDLFDVEAASFAGAATLDSQLSVTIARTAGDAGDVVLLNYGVHYEVDSLGSSTISSK